MEEFASDSQSMTVPSMNPATSTLTKLIEESCDATQHSEPVWGVGGRTDYDSKNVVDPGGVTGFDPFTTKNGDMNAAVASFSREQVSSPTQNGSSANSSSTINNGVNPTPQTSSKKSKIPIVLAQVNDSILFMGSTDNLMDDVDDGSRDSQPLQLRSARVVSAIPGHSMDDETSCQILLQVLLPYLIAGAGMVAAGLVLDVVQHWPAFVTMPEIFVLVPALLGLKGNLEMTLASRLSTAANLGRLDAPDRRRSHIMGNLALIQCQALVVACCASSFAVCLSWATRPKGHFRFEHAMLLSAASMTTASIASMLLGTLMVAIIVLSRRFRINPDNIATPIAASLGDITTLVILSWTVSAITSAHERGATYLAPTISIFCFLAIPFWAFITYRHEQLRNVLLHGWIPVLAAMAISSAGGLILKVSVSRFKGIAVFQPVMNGVGGNLVAVQASRLSTWLHSHAPELGKLPHSLLSPRSTGRSSGDGGGNCLSAEYRFSIADDDFDADFDASSLAPLMDSAGVSSQDGFKSAATVVLNKLPASEQQGQHVDNGAAISSQPRLMALASDKAEEVTGCQWVGLRCREYAAAVCPPPNPIPVFAAQNDVKARAARVLMLLVIPGHLAFMALIYIIEAGHTRITPGFATAYCIAALCQVAALVYVCDWMVHAMWALGVDPDNAAIPYLTALGDFLGTGLLAATFWILFEFGEKDTYVADPGGIKHSSTASLFSTTTSSLPNI